MFHIDDTIINHLKIDVINRYLNCRALGIRCRNILLRINNFACHKTGQLLLHNMVSCNRQILINGKVNIISGFRVYVLHNGHHLTGGINNYFLITFLTMKSGFHITLNSTLSYNIIDAVSVLFAALSHNPLI